MEATVANVSDLPIGSLKMVRVGNHRICLVHTSSGIYALDNACPHEGYGLTQGSLSGELLTCEWHNWKFDVADGSCVVGEEGVRTHAVRVGEDGSIVVALAVADPSAEVPRLLESLRSGIRNDYMGQVSRDVVRLLRAGAKPADLVWEAVAYGAPRSEYGWGHSLASATDCLAMVELFDGDARALPVVQAIAGIAETERGRPVAAVPGPVAGGTATAFRHALEDERLADAQAMVLGSLDRGSDELARWFTLAVSDHHLSYGHGAIYAQKAFELLAMIGWDRADTVLPHLVTALVYGTREDRLPYMRPFMRALDGLDLTGIVNRAVDPIWSDDGGLLHVLLESHDRTGPLVAARNALENGAGVDAVLDVVVQAVSERMLRYDTEGEFDFSDDFGWLDITHGLTYANAARWHAARTPGPDTLRLALFSVFLASWTGRHEWHTQVAHRAEVDLGTTDPIAAGVALQHEALSDRTSQFIVFAHAVKASRAAAFESARTGTLVPLMATARFMRAPRLERFIAAGVARSIDFVSGRVRRDD